MLLWAICKSFRVTMIFDESSLKSLFLLPTLSSAILIQLSNCDKAALTVSSSLASPFFDSSSLSLSFLFRSYLFLTASFSYNRRLASRSALYLCLDALTLLSISFVIGTSCKDGWRKIAFLNNSLPQWYPPSKKVHGYPKYAC